MSSIASMIAQAVLGWFGSLLTGWMQRSEDKAQGRKDQAADDTAAAQKADTDAKTIDDRDGALSDDDLNKRLRP